MTTKIKLTRPVVIRGKPGAKVGDVVEVDGFTANDLLASGCGVTHTEQDMSVPLMETRIPAFETRDPQPRIKRKTLP